MVNVAEGTLNEVDVIMWLVEPTTYIGAGEQHIAELLSKVKTPGDSGDQQDRYRERRGDHCQGHRYL